MLFLKVVYCNIKRIILWNFILTSFQLAAAYKQLCGRCVNATASNTMHWGCRQRTWIFWEHRACTWGRSQTWRSASEVEVSAAHFVTGGRTCSSLCRGLRRCSSAVLVSPRTGCRRVRRWAHIPDRHSIIYSYFYPCFREFVYSILGSYSYVHNNVPVLHVIFPRRNVQSGNNIMQFRMLRDSV